MDAFPVFGVGRFLPAVPGPRAVQQRIRRSLPTVVGSPPNRRRKGAMGGGEMSMGNRLTLCVLAGALVTAACGGPADLSQRGEAAPTTSSTAMVATTSSTV